MTQLAKSTNGTVRTIQTSQTTDLLKAEPIIVRKNKGEDPNAILAQVISMLSYTSEQLDIASSPSKLKGMADDLIDQYKTDSLEDIREALKKGRRGHYGNNYGKLNMIVISGWMKLHLEEKAKAREAQIQKEKALHNQDHSGDRLIDIICNREDNLRQMMKEGKPRAELDKEFSEIQKLKDQLKENTKSFLSKEKKGKEEDQGFNEFKRKREEDPKQLRLNQLRALAKHENEESLMYLISQLDDCDDRQIYKEELKRRENEQSKHKKHQEAS